MLAKKGMKIMTREEAISEIKRQLPAYLAQAHGIQVQKGKCFRCVNPDHLDRTPSMSLYTDNKGYPRCKCFGCGKSYDTLSLIGLDNHTEDFNQEIEIGCDLFGIQIEGQNAKIGQSGIDKAVKMERIKKAGYVTTASCEIEKVIDFTAQVDRAAGKIADEATEDVLGYDKSEREIRRKKFAIEGDEDTAKKLEHRQVSLDVLNQFKIGYDAKGFNDFVSGVSGLQEHKDDKAKEYKIFIPFLDADGKKASYFIAELVDRSKVEKYPKYLKPSLKKDEDEKEGKRKVLRQPYFQEFYLTDKEKTPKELYIVEGVWSAIELEACGRHALALCGAQIYKKFLTLCENNKESLKDTVFYIATDADATGESAADGIAAGLDELGLMHVRAKPANLDDEGKTIKEGEAGWKKDLGEMYESETLYGQYSPEQAAERLRGRLQELEEEGSALRYEKQEEEIRVQEEKKEAYQQRSAGAQLSEFLATTKKNSTIKSLSTGISDLDNYLAGGLRPGRLYIIGGMSAIGKTAFALQMADHFALLGRDVLYISLEMSHIELMSRSISRESALESVKECGETWHAKTAAQIEQGEMYQDITAEDLECLSQSIETYKRYANRVYIHEGEESLNVETVRELVKTHIEMTGENPVVIVDYMQIMAPVDMHMTDKQNADQQIKVLKHIARDQGVIVIALSSFNRGSYGHEATRSAYKETGAIEYTADACLALQYAGLDGTASTYDSIDKANCLKKKQGMPIDVEITSLKSRQGYEDDVKLSYFSRFNLFLPGDADIKDVSNLTSWN